MGTKVKRRTKGGTAGKACRESQQETARVSGLSLRVKNVPFWRDVERDFRRCKSQWKRKQCRARAVEAKHAMLTFPSARPRSNRRISDGRKFSGRYGGFVRVDDCLGPSSW